MKNAKSGMQLLIFCDASTKAYATVTYLRIRDASFPTNFLISKVRLVPVRQSKKKKI